jgi:hypothetical protein
MGEQQLRFFENTVEPQISNHRSKAEFMLQRINFDVVLCASICGKLCVCVCERERERERGISGCGPVGRGQGHNDAFLIEVIPMCYEALKQYRLNKSVVIQIGYMFRSLQGE